MEAFFQHLENYIALSEEEKSFLRSRLKQRTYLKGQYIVQAGDICQHNTYVVRGKVRSFCLGPDDHEHILSFGIENWWVGDLGSFINQEPADFNVQCLAKTEVVQISYDDLQHLYLAMPKIERFFRLIIQKAYVNAQKRIISSYSLPARERYLLFCKEYPEIAQRVPQYMIASYLGITKEFLSTIRSQIAKA
ncbi:MAG: Crp/Fnr family transcriptional regulator [Bacteroidota bacterium]